VQHQSVIGQNTPAFSQTSINIPNMFQHVAGENQVEGTITESGQILGVTDQVLDVWSLPPQYRLTKPPMTLLILLRTNQSVTVLCDYEALAPIASTKLQCTRKS
jgi:uncharacterized membrane protein YfhO